MSCGENVNKPDDVKKKFEQNLWPNSVVLEKRTMLELFMEWRGDRRHRCQEGVFSVSSYRRDRVVWEPCHWPGKTR